MWGGVARWWERGIAVRGGVAHGRERSAAPGGTEGYGGAWRRGALVGEMNGGVVAWHIGGRDEWRRGGAAHKDDWKIVCLF